MDDWYEEAEVMIGKVDDLAVGAPKQLPDDVALGISAAQASVVIELPKDQHQAHMHFLIAFMKSLWRAGWNAGRRSVDVLPRAGRG